MENSFFEKVYNTVKLIPKGYVCTYGEIAKYLKTPTMARQVGWALHKNPNPKLIPCHRIVFADGSLSSNFAFGGMNAQYQLLINEGIVFKDNKVDMKKHFYHLI